MGNPRIHPDTFYRNGVPLPASFYQALDTAQQQAINADAGGLWSPVGTIALSGAGLWLSGPSTMATGAGINTIPASGKRLVHAANDVPLLAPGHDLGNHTISTSCNGLGTQTSPGISGGFNGAPTYGALVGQTVGSRFVVPLDVHNLGTFSDAFLTMRAATHTSLPATAPMMRVYAVDAFGDVFPLGGVAGTAGFVSLTLPGSVSLYSGQPQVLLYPINAGVVINRLYFSYFAEIVDESGSGAFPGNQYDAVVSQFENIGSLLFP